MQHSNNPDTSHPVAMHVYPDAMPFDPPLVEARFAAGLVAAEQMPSLAWNALEGGLDGPDAELWEYARGELLTDLLVSNAFGCASTDSVAVATMNGRAWLDRTVLWIACAAAFLTLAIPALGADDAGPIAQMYHSAWTARDGLNGVVSALAQTADGFLWVGTTEGLYRFDGVTFEAYKPETGNFPATGIKTLDAGPDGLWIGYLSGGVSVLKDGRLKNYSERDGLPISRVRSIVHTEDGKVWAATVGGVARLDGDRWHKVRSDWNFTAKAARKLLVDPSGTLWASVETGILYLPKGAHSFEDAGVQTHQIFSMAPAPDGSVVYADFRKAGEPEVCRLQMKPGGSVVRCISLPDIQSASDIQSVFVDRRGSFWFTGDNVIHLAHPELLSWNGGRISRASIDEYGKNDGLTASTDTMLEDHEGNIWIGTDKGLDRFRQRNLRWYPAPDNQLLFNLAQGDAGEIWASTSGGPMYRIAAGKLIPGSPNDVRYFYRDPSGALWASRHDGIWAWSGGRFVKQAVPRAVDQILPVTSADPMIVVSAAADSSGGVWIAIGGRGEFYVKGGEWRFVPVLKDHPDWAANAAAVDNGGRLWLANDAHLAAYKDGVSQVYDDVKGPGIGPIKTIGELADSVLIGGELGLSAYHGGGFHRIEPADGSSFGRVISIVSTPANGVWLEATPGIVHIAADELASAVEHPGYRVRCDILDTVTDLPDPLQGGFSQNEALQAKDGSLWFATVQGFAQVNPSLRHNPLAPPMAIRSMVADDRKYSTLSPARLPALTRNIRFDYAALSLSIPERERFRYKLDGLDSKWREVGSIRQAVYDNLGPGKYTFRVIACNNDGVWNMTGATMAFTILPAWYQTSSFRIGCIGAFLLLLWVLYQLRLRQLHRQFSIGLEARVSERTRIARELHDTLLQGVQGLMLRLQAVDKMLPARPMDAKKALEGALDRGDQAIIEGREAITHIRVPTLASPDLAKSIAELMADLNEELDEGSRGSATFRVLVEGAPRTVRRNIQGEIYCIARESLGNAFRHAQARHIETEITYGESLHLRFRDDGKGIDPGVVEHGERPGHWGLLGIRERAKQIGAQLEILSEPGAGTEIELSIPGSLAYDVFTTKGSFRIFPGRMKRDR
jgi:signal transduction histidine kinase/ligand-binding sensor domain-containing protein